MKEKVNEKGDPSVTYAYITFRSTDAAKLVK